MKTNIHIDISIEEQREINIRKKNPGFKTGAGKHRNKKRLEEIPRKKKHVDF